jgi:hypothetical protein
LTASEYQHVLYLARPQYQVPLLYNRISILEKVVWGMVRGGSCCSVPGPTAE